ncbi:MAG: hypothetical protein IJA86_02215 [Clostridia bacterium]|nr:hypothetical protein [Clostridia bacterium]
MNENMKELGLYAPYFPEETETDDEMMNEMDVKETEDEILGEQDYMAADASYAVQTEKEFSIGTDEYFDTEEEYASLPVEKTEDYVCMPNIDFDNFDM